MHFRFLPFLLLSGILAIPVRASAQFACTQLGFALVEHSCFHATFGPFVGITAASQETALSALPRLDDVHTFYEVTLPSPLTQNSLSYRIATPTRAGEWAFFHDPDVYLEILDEAGQALPVLLEHGVPECSELPQVSVFRLEDQRYRINLGPGNQSRCVLVIENVSDFTARTGRDLDADGYGSPVDTKLALCTPEPGYVTNISDCDDTRPEINTGAPELCDGIDQNCNGIPDDEGLPCRAGKGVCERSGVWHCATHGQPPVCVVANAGVPTAEVCDGMDSNCNGVDDLHEEQLCELSEAPSCVNVLGKVRCGCTTDSDCGETTSGRVCDEATRECVDGCVNLSGRNACPADTECTSEDPAQIGHCVTPGDMKAGSRAEAEADVPPVVAAPSAAGCDCRLGAPTSPVPRSVSFAALFILGFAWAARRRGV